MSNALPTEWAYPWIKGIPILGIVTPDQVSQMGYPWVQGCPGVWGTDPLGSGCNHGLQGLLLHGTLYYCVTCMALHGAPHSYRVIP